MKRIAMIILLVLLLTGCAGQQQADIAATTLPVYEFTVRLCSGTDLTVTRLVTENVSCLHDYTLQVRQMRAVEQAELVMLSGAGLEDFLQDALESASATVDASQGLALQHAHHHHGDHDHGDDPHIWLSPENAKHMARNLCDGLCRSYPEQEAQFRKNLEGLLQELDDLQAYGEQTLSTLSCRELVTFHDGFSYFAESFGLTVLKAVEEESGSEASAGELIELIGLVRQHGLPAVFTETNGSDAAASILAAETGVKVYTLDMAMAGDSYFTAMYRNIDTVKEALG